MRAQTDIEARLSRVEALVGLPAAPEPQPAPRPPSVLAICAACAAAFHVRLHDLLAEGRQAHVALPRQVAMHLARRLTAHSYPTIGRAMRRDHSTVMHGDRTIAARVQRDPELARTVEALAAHLTPAQETPR